MTTYHHLDEMIKKIILSYLMFFFLITCALAQSNQLEPKQWLSISDGLAHNGVTSILEDSKGYLWVGTYDGLNRYDGYEIKVFKNKVREKIFVSNRIRTIAEDSNNNLWIGTDEGISIYNRNQESFSNLYSNKLTNKKLKGPVVRQILFNHKNKLSICATEGYGLLVFNQDYTLDNQYLPQNDVPERPISFLNGLALDEQHYLFTTSAGLLLFNIETKEFTKILAEDINRANSRFNNSSILKMAKNELLVTLSNGLALINYTKNETGYTFQLKNTRLDSYNINSAAIDSLGQLWLGDLTNGFLRIDDVAAFRNNQAFETATFRANTDLLRSSCIIPTSVGCWLGTFNKGLYLFDWKENPFKFYHTGMKKEYGLQSNQILSISPIDSHQVYMTANRGGVALFNTQKQTFSPLPFALAAETQLGVPRISVDAQKDIWLKQGRGSYLLHFKGDNTIQENITEKFPFLKNITIRTIVDDNTGNIWLGTLEGLFKIQLDENREVLNVETINDHPFFASNPMSNVRHIYVDPAFDFIWIGTKSDGLFRINIQASQSLAAAKIEQYVNDESAPSSISSNFVTASIRLPNNTFWISTEGGGICQVLNSDTQPSFKTFSEADGLSNNVVKGMLYDGQNHLWISTNIGLNRFDTETFQLRSYSKADGLPFEAFDYACAKLDNGLMLFSGLEGLCYFNPNELKEDTHLPTLDFEGLKVLNVPVTPGELVNDRILLSQSLANTDVLHLNHNENVFSIKLKSLGFSKSKNYRLQHRLLPINENWIETPSDQQEIFYNGLPPKQYTLQVRASNALNEWTAPKALTIKINPPFWKTKWAYLSYVILSLWLIAMVVFAVLRIQSLNHNLEIEKLEKSNIKEINASKLRLFSNISHEIKTPITLISGPVSLLIDRFRGNLPIQEKLELIQRQSNKIAALVDQVHDFQKSDAQALKLKKTHFNFNAFVEELIKDFEFMAKSDQRKFKVKRPETTTYVLADKNKLEKIINNLLNNAFKYTQQGDTIQLTYSSDDKDLVITVTDTGIGMSQEDLPYIFKRFYQAKNHHPDIGGTGIGLAFSKRLVDMHFGFITVESELHQGSTFTVQLPIVNPAPTALEIEKEKALLSLEKKSLPIDLIDRKVELSNIQLKDDFSEQQIFLVEDNVELRTFTSEVLSKFFKVMTFSNGKECLDKMEKVWPDIIVSDIMMPEVNGLELCRQIKSEVKTSHIPVILLTARTTVDDQIQGLKDGADAYIKKPFDVQHLIIKIAALLDSRKQLRERFQIDNPIALDKTREHNNDTIFLEKLYALIAENLDNQDLDIDSFAKKLYLNRTHFYQKVKALTNETPYELMKAYRLKQAAAILVQQNLSVTEVYVMTGFKSRTHFSKLFKEKYGISPGKYAKSQ